MKINTVLHFFALRQADCLKYLMEYLGYGPAVENTWKAETLYRAIFQLVGSRTDSQYYHNCWWQTVVDNGGKLSSRFEERSHKKCPEEIPQ